MNNVIDKKTFFYFYTEVYNEPVDIRIYISIFSFSE